MSKQRALDAINAKKTDRIPQWDFPDNPALAERLFDYDIWADTERASVDLLKHFDIDLVHCIPGGVAEWNFPLVRYYGDISLVDDPRCRNYLRAYKKSKSKPYRSMYDELNRTSNGAFWGMAPTMTMNGYGVDSPEAVLAFNPLEHAPWTLEERTTFFKQYYSEKQNLLNDSCLMMGWYYNTLFMWPVEIFGWENFMMAAMIDPKRFKEILMQFLQITKRDIEAISQATHSPIIACHDDLCSAKGPMFRPSWYNENIFPYYKEIFGIIREAGKKALFVCDGNVIPLLDDILTSNPDGIAIDGHSNLEAVMEKFSGKIICGGMNPGILSNGAPADIASMVRETAEIVKGERGYFFQCAGMNGLAPVDNIIFYQNCLREYGAR